MHIFSLLLFFLLTFSLQAISEFETGIKTGPAFKGRDNFENNLGNYRSNLSPNVLNHTTLSPPRQLFLTEIFFNRRIVSGHKIGFALGNLNFQNFNLKEVNTAEEYTNIDFGLHSLYFMTTYHYEYALKRSRNYSIEGGFGIGVNQTEMSLQGRRISPLGLTDINGNLSGSGLQYKMEGAIHKQLGNSFRLELGLMLGMTAVASLEGNLGDSSGTLYVRSDGTVTPMTQPQYTNYAVSNQTYARALEMKITFTSIYFGASALF